MPGWDEIARDNLLAAQCLRQAPSAEITGDYTRSVIGRSYYAAFSAVTHVLRGSANYPSGRETPAHQLVPVLLQRHLRNRMRPQRLREVTAAVRRLYAARLDADYHSQTINEMTLLSTLRDACRVLKELGVQT